MNQRSRLTNRRMYPNRTPPLATCQPQDFAERLAEHVRRIPRAGLTKQEKQLIWDLGRSERRYAFRMLQRVLDLFARHCTDAAEAEAAAELVRGYVLSGRAPGSLDLSAAFDAETQAQGHADVAQRSFERRRDRASKDAATAALHRQLVETRRSLDAVQAVAV